MGRLWGNFHKLEKEALEYSVSRDNQYDEVLIKYDIIGTIAHAKMLNRIGILTDEELKETIFALNELKKEVEEGHIKISIDEEDCHTKIENYLTQNTKTAGKKIHTARSRNDQVVTALRLYYKDKLKEVKNATKKLIKSLKELDKKFGNIVIPGFTHTRKAIPTTVSIWIGSFIESLEDDLKVIDSIKDILIDQNPLGSGAGYGIPLIEVDRTFTQKLLHFKKVQNNPLYVQNSRGKFESAIAFGLSMIMLDLNKLSSDIILFSEEEFGFVELPQNFLTGSSMMPNKANPDIFEIARANYSKIVSLEHMLQILPMNLISGYHRDLQLTKEAIFEIFNTTINTISIFAKVVKILKIDEEKAKKLIKESMYATELANKLVLEGKPFRDAYMEIKKNLNKTKGE